MYCGNCFRDNALVGALRRMGHSALMVPLYLPLTLDEPDNSAGTPIFFGGVNVYLEQLSPLFGRMPAWLHRSLASPRVLRWAAGRAARTRAQDVGALTISMLAGEEGRQARELDELTQWLKTTLRPDVVCLSNALLVGMARKLKKELGAPVICFLQGEDFFLDSLADLHRKQAWDVLAQRASEMDGFIAPSRYFASHMTKRLGLAPDRVRVIHNGIRVDGYRPAEIAPRPPVLGFFARLCREKGVDTVVEAFMKLKERDRVKGLRLHAGGNLGPADRPLMETLQRKLDARGLTSHFALFPNTTLEGKQEFLRSLSVFSVPALYGEAFGLYLLEALASGVPVVQPRVAAFPELIEATGGGILCEPGNVQALAESIEELLLHPARSHALGQAGRKSVLEKFTVETMAQNLLGAFAEFGSDQTIEPSTVNQLR